MISKLLTARMTYPMLGYPIEHLSHAFQIVSHAVVVVVGLSVAPAPSKPQVAEVAVHRVGRAPANYRDHGKHHPEAHESYHPQGGKVSTLL